MVTEQKKNLNFRIVGQVISDKMDKSLVVEAKTRVKHKVLGKFISRKYKVYAHDQNNEAVIGDKVLVEEIARPLSKKKRWILKKIVERAQ